MPPPAMDTGNPYSTPTSEPAPPDEGVPEVLELASRGERLGAALVDGIIIGILSAAVSMGWGRLVETSLPANLGEEIMEITASPFWGSFIESIVGFLMFIAIHGYFLAENGQTLGKKLLGIKIVTMGGTKPRMEALLLLRTLVPILLGTIPIAGPYLYLAGIIIIFARPRRCFHDYIAGTKVVQAVVLPKGITREREDTEQVPVRFPELILTPIIRKHLGVEPQSLGEATSWAGDLGKGGDEIRAFHEEISRSFPSASLLREQPSRTYGELLAALAIPIGRMMRVPGKITYRAPVKPGE